MKLSTKGRYAIKAMINIAISSRNAPKTLLEISKHQGISLSYLEQLFALLRKNNLVSGVRGPGGGYRLSTDPENITIAQIVRAINADMAQSTTADQKDEVIWDKFSDKLCNYLETVTLGSLIKDDTDSDNRASMAITEESVIKNSSWNSA